MSTDTRTVFVKAFDAKDADGRAYRIAEWQNIVIYEPLIGERQELPALRDLRCDGDHVRRLSQGKYRLMRSRITSPDQPWEVELSSDDPDSP